jgi:hypothetical protein
LGGVRTSIWADGKRWGWPQMTLWLPEDEGAQLRFEFDTELARLEAA